MTQGMGCSFSAVPEQDQDGFQFLHVVGAGEFFPVLVVEDDCRSYKHTCLGCMVEALVAVHARLRTLQVRQAQKVADGGAFPAAFHREHLVAYALRQTFVPCS